jgi:class 3 adenylate cyclase
MLAFNHETAAALATVQAFYSMVATSRSIATLNTRASEQRQIRLRFALHYGEVDAVEGDREGPTVSYTFRLAAVSAASLKDAYSPMPAENFPTHDYIILSQRAVELLQERGLHYEWEQVGLLSLKGFEGYHQLYLVRNLSALTLPVSPDGGI